MKGWYIQSIDLEALSIFYLFFFVEYRIKIRGDIQVGSSHSISQVCVAIFYTRFGFFFVWRRASFQPCNKYLDRRKIHCKLDMTNRRIIIKFLIDLQPLFHVHW